MAPVKNGRHIFKEIPTGFPEPGKTTVYDESETIDLEKAPLNGGFLVKTLVLSIDPYMRGRMRDPTIESYAPPYLIGEPLNNFGVGKVLRSENPAFKAGDHIYGMLPFQEYFIAQNPKEYRLLENKEGLPWSVYVGVCGMPGQTAYYAWKEWSDAKKGEVAFVTAASGPVGATVVQLAKGDGCKVIASAGSDEKVAFVNSLGADVTFNYKTVPTRKVLQKEGPINIYWDNVGGETLEAAIDAAETHSRFIECGMISQYNTQDQYPIKNLIYVVAKQLKIYGFIVFTLHAKYEEQFYKEMPRRVAAGEIKYQEDFTHGLDKVGEAILDVQTGKNKGKKVIIVAND
ncbi:NAD-P-binding protein [Obba rivulosa]|uniref:NAD-P-binding protein n=1 Tax=Obba rivulosa TaxID=1052685 RepID=A0A8E2DV47_9APHY|nr:NAD-P-binding protein [Obba rivulosa]